MAGTRIAIRRGSITTPHHTTNTQTAVKVLASGDDGWGYPRRVVELARTVALSLAPG